MREFCDKCHSKIIDGNCECGKWYDEDNQPKEAIFFKKALETFFSLNQSILSLDDNRGNAAVFFKGNYEDVVKVKEFIKNLKKYD